MPFARPTKDNPPSNRLPASGARQLTIGALIAACLGVSACVPLAATGLAIGAMAVIDRRTIGAQTEDQGIEIKAVRELNNALSDSSGVAVTSFNRRVLLTGQVLSGIDKQNAGSVIAGLPNVRGVYNELEVSNKAGISAGVNDTTLTTRVKTALLRDDNVPGNSVKVKTESGVVYLLGLVTNNEAQRAAELASRVAGVQRVVTVFEVLSEEDARRLTSEALEQPTPSGTTPAVVPPQPAPGAAPVPGQSGLPAPTPQGLPPQPAPAPMQPQVPQQAPQVAPPQPQQLQQPQIQQQPATRPAGSTLVPPPAPAPMVPPAPSPSGFQPAPAEQQQPSSQPPLVAPRQ